MTSSHYAGWSQDRINQAHERYVAGQSATEIARALGGGLTRNAVIGKTRRMGWISDHRQKPTSTGKLRAPVSKPMPVKPPRPGPQNKPGAVFGKVSVDNDAETERKRSIQQEEGQRLVASMASPANDDAIPLISRGRLQCAFPVGEPDRPANQMCCGQPVPDDAARAVLSYCAKHGRVALSKNQPARKVPSEPGQRRAA